jgi:hypothetical protein
MALAFANSKAVTQRWRSTSDDALKWKVCKQNGAKFENLKKN